jgi:hypothetical protein
VAGAGDRGLKKAVRRRPEHGQVVVQGVIAREVVLVRPGQAVAVAQDASARFAILEVQLASAAQLADEEQDAVPQQEATVVDEAVLAASLPLLGWFAAFVVINAAYIPLPEEPGLAKRFGDEYLAYKQNVRRWVPRLRPWEAQGPDGEAGPP